MLMRRSAFEAAGGFDEGYWMYMEDLDLSYRLAQEGWLSWYEPAATVRHVKGGTVGGPRPLRLNWHFHRGMYRFYRQPLRAAALAGLNALVYVGIAVKLAASVAQSFAAPEPRAPAPSPAHRARQRRRVAEHRAAADRTRRACPREGP